MKDEKKRTLYLKVRVSPEEMAAIKKKFANSGMSSLSGFVRAMIFEGYIAQVNENELKELTRIANNVANNINQIARRANVTNKVYKEDIEEVESLLEFRRLGDVRDARARRSGGMVVGYDDGRRHRVEGVFNDDAGIYYDLVNPAGAQHGPGCNP